MSSKAIESLVNDISKLTVIELAELTKELEGKFGVSAMAMPAAGAHAAGAAPAPAAAKDEEKSEYKVELVSGSEENKMKIIKALRQVKKDLGLIEAKKLVEEAPAVVAESVPAAEAKAMKEALEAAGAKVKLS
jgi:large subunit ribosomal protein L7/L12